MVKGTHCGESAGFEYELAEDLEFLSADLYGERNECFGIHEKKNSGWERLDRNRFSTSITKAARQNAQQRLRPIHNRSASCLAVGSVPFAPFV